MVLCKRINDALSCQLDMLPFLPCSPTKGEERVKGNRLTYPDHNYATIQHFLTMTRSFQPFAPYMQHDHKDSCITNECRSHNVVSQTLAQFAITTETESGGYAE